MGNSMLKPLKTKSDYIKKQLGDKISTDFEENKKVLNSLDLPLSKKTRNRMAGYLVRVSKKAKK